MNQCSGKFSISKLLDGLFIKTFLTLVIGASVTVFADVPTPNPSAGPDFLWTQKDPRDVRVKLNPTTKGVSVTINKREKVKPPRSVTITFRDPDGKAVPVDLIAAEPLHYPARYEGTLPSSVSTANQSAMGFELKIPFRVTKPKVLKSEDLERSSIP